MKKQKTRFSYIYGHMREQILSGHLRYGSKLPSAGEISETYAVGLRTARSVLHALRDEGLAEIEERKRAVVVYKVPSLKENPDIVKTILSRKQAILDIFQTMELLFPDILAFCARFSHIIDLEHYDAVIHWIHYNRDTTGRWKAVSAFIQELLQSSGNPLLGDLFSGLELHALDSLLLEYKYDVLRDWPKVEKQDFDRVLNALRSKHSPAIRSSFRTYFHTQLVLISGVLDHLSHQFPGVPQDLQRRFTWFIDPGPGLSHFYQRIARDIAEKIGVGFYPQDSFLPSLNALAESYQVSFHTIRRALLSLSDLGIVKQINGKGTQVLTRNVYERVKNETKIPVMLYMNAVQLMTLIIRPAALLSFGSLNHTALLSLKRGLEEPHAVPLTLLLYFVIESSPLQALQNILREINHILKWGFYFYRFNKKSSEYVNFLALKAFTCLQRGERQAFADLLFECYCHILTRVRESLAAQGYTQAAHISTPS